MAGKTRRELIGARLWLAMVLVAMGGTATLALAQTAPLAIQNVQATADQVTLQGTRKIQAAAFILGDPIRLMVDIRGATLDSSAPASIPVNGDPIQSVTVSSLKAKDQSVVRLEVSLTRDVDWQIQPRGDSLTISLTPRQIEIPKDIPEDMYEQARKVEEKLYATGTYTAPPSGIQIPEGAALNQPVVVQRTYPTAPSRPAVPAPSRPAVAPTLPAVKGTATQVKDILYRFSGSKVQILIKTNGVVGNYHDFTLDQPNRLVIDLPGLKEASVKDRFAIGHSGVQRVRLGAHPGKTRVVIDFPGPIPAYSFSRVKQGLVITLSPP